MTPSVAIWTLVFFLVTTAFLLLPFYPAWHEWRYPTDALALPLPGQSPKVTMSLPVEVKLDPTGTQRPVIQASERILVPRGSAFRKLVAPSIEFGSIQHISEPSSQERKSLRPKPTSLLNLPNAQTWGKKGWRVKGHCQIHHAKHLVGSLVVLGPLNIGADCVIEGDIKAHGVVKIGPRSRITGSVFSAHEISLAEGVCVHGSVMSESRIDLAAHCAVGRTAQPATVCAPHIEAGHGACVHGTLWAHELGRMT